MTLEPVWACGDCSAPRPVCKQRAGGRGTARTACRPTNGARVLCSVRESSFGISEIWNAGKHTAMGARGSIQLDVRRSTPSSHPRLLPQHTARAQASPQALRSTVYGKALTQGSDNSFYVGTDRTANGRNWQIMARLGAPAHAHLRKAERPRRAGNSIRGGGGSHSAEWLNGARPCRLPRRRCPQSCAA